MKAALGILANAPAARKVAVVGDMLELEPFAERLHREVGEYAAELSIDTLVTVGTRAGWLAEAALEGDMEDVRPWRVIWRTSVPVRTRKKPRRCWRNSLHPIQHFFSRLPEGWRWRNCVRL